jgi:hypothetical protein
MGKGSRPRPVDKKRYDENYDAIFRAKESYEKASKIAPFNGRKNRANTIPPASV